MCKEEIMSIRDYLGGKEWAVTIFTVTKVVKLSDAALRNRSNYQQELKKRCSLSHCAWRCGGSAFRPTVHAARL